MRRACSVVFILAFGGSIMAASCRRSVEEEASARVMQAWDAKNNPLGLYWNFETDFYKFPLQASLQNIPWADSYWPTQRGGIAQRWKGSGEGFGYRLHTLPELKKMSEEQIKRLSPAEKFDIFTGNYTYPTVRREWKRTRPSAGSWEGICHGWAPASTFYLEPEPVTLTGAHGIRVPFGSSDVKALLSYHQGEVEPTVNRMIGLRCQIKAVTEESPRSNACTDVNAGAFHVAMVNFIALRKQGFIIDRVRDFQVWNHPVHTYRTKIVSEQAPSKKAASGTVRELVMETELTFTIEIQPTWEAQFPTKSRSDETKRYKYQLELNVNDEIIGGEWLTADRPDFVWFEEKAEFTGAWQPLAKIYAASTAYRSSDSGFPAPATSPSPGAVDIPSTPTVPSDDFPSTDPTPFPTFEPPVVPTFEPPALPTRNPPVIPTAEPNLSPSSRPPQ